MTTDIVERLRAGNQVLLPILGEAANEIERLRAENKRLLQEREGLIPNDPGWLEGLKRR